MCQRFISRRKSVKKYSRYLYIFLKWVERLYIRSKYWRYIHSIDNNVEYIQFIIGTQKIHIHANEENKYVHNKSICTKIQHIYRISWEVKIICHSQNFNVMRVISIVPPVLNQNNFKLSLSSETAWIKFKTN